jgi:hypothetical protein
VPSVLPRILLPKTPCPGSSRASTSQVGQDLRAKDVDGRTKSTKSGHGDPLWLHRIAASQPPPVPRTALQAMRMRRSLLTSFAALNPIPGGCTRPAFDCYIHTLMVDKLARIGYKVKVTRSEDPFHFGSGFHAWVIGYFAKIASARLNALSIACSGVIPLVMTSSIATLNTCSALTSAIAGLNAS